MTGVLALPQPARLVPRLLSGLYEGLLLVGVVMLAGFVLAPVGKGMGLSGGDLRTYNRAWILLVLSLYFLWFWLHGGQTLPMKTWRIRLCRADGAPLPFEIALLRLALVFAGWGLGGLHFLWAIFDRDGQFLHDRIVGSRIVQLE